MWRRFNFKQCDRSLKWEYSQIITEIIVLDLSSLPIPLNFNSLTRLLYRIIDFVCPLLREFSLLLFLPSYSSKKSWLGTCDSINNNLGLCFTTTSSTFVVSCSDSISQYCIAIRPDCMRKQSAIINLLMAAENCRNATA